jgi:SAM-dependent methyltransferase
MAAAVCRPCTATAHGAADGKRGSLMAEVTTGIRRLLGRPVFYDLVQSIFRAKSGRSEFVREFVQPRPGERVLDIGAGTSDLLAYLPADVGYVGIEPSTRYSEAARARFGERGTFVTGIYDAVCAHKLGQFDAVLLSGVVHHLDDAQVLALYRLVRDRGLAQAGRLVAIDPVFDDGQAALARLFISMDRGRNVRNAKQYRALAAAVFGEVECEIRHRSLPPYTHCVMRCRTGTRVAADSMR